MAELEQKRTGEAKRAMLEALKKTMGIVTPALELAKVSRTAHYGWLKDDPDYKAEVDEANEIVLDFGETQLHNLMTGVLVQGKEYVYERPPDTAAIIFFNKTRNKKRGYVERQEITGADGKNVINELHVKIIRDKATGITPGEFTPQSASGTGSEEAV